MLRDIVLAAFRRDVEGRDENNNGDETEDGRAGAGSSGGYDTKVMDNANYPTYLFDFN